jgi:hypothetical protein
VAKRKRRKKKSSRLPLVLLVLLMAAVGGLVVFAANRADETGESPAVIGGADTSVPSDSNSTDPAPSASEPDGTVAPPVTVHIETSDTDHSDGAVLDDFTEVDPPVIPAISAVLESSWITKGAITAELPDGYYWGYVDSSSDEPERTVTFELRQVYWGSDACRAEFGEDPDACLDDYGSDPSLSGLFEVSVADLIFVSLPTFGDPATGAFTSRSINPANWWPLVNGRQTTVSVPDDDTEAIVLTPYLLTVIEGRVVAAEGIRVP